MYRAVVGAFLVFGVLASLTIGASSVGAETEPEECLQLDHPEIERLRDTYHWLDEAAERARVYLVDSFDDPVAGTATHLLARVRILDSYCNDVFLGIYLHEMAHIFHRNNGVYVNPILREGFRERYCRMLEGEFFADSISYIFHPQQRIRTYYWLGVTAPSEWFYDFAERQNVHESNAEDCLDLTIALIPSCDDVRDVERILKEEQEEIELPPVQCASLYQSDSPDPDSPESDGEADDAAPDTDGEVETEAGE